MKSFDPKLQVASAGTHPALIVHPRAVQVMKELGIDISNNRPKHVSGFIDDSFDYVITVCNHAKETCPIFTGNVQRYVHLGFDDPAGATGTEEEVLQMFRRVRDEIHLALRELYTSDVAGADKSDGDAKH